MTAMKLRDDITGIVLAGGKSSRMGTDKALLNVRGKTFIQHVAETLQKVCSAVSISANAGEPYKFLGLPIMKDIFQDCGPLAGIHSALIHAKTDAVFVLSCDMPFIDEATIRLVIGHAGEGDVVVAQDSSRIHPLCGYYHKRCLEPLTMSLKNGLYSVNAFVEQMNHKSVSLPGLRTSTHQVLLNVNSPEDYKQIIGGQGRSLTPTRG